LLALRQQVEIQPYRSKCQAEANHLDLARTTAVRGPANPKVATPEFPANPKVATPEFPANPKVATPEFPANPKVGNKVVNMSPGRLECLECRPE